MLTEDSVQEEQPTTRNSENDDSGLSRSGRRQFVRKIVGIAAAGGLASVLMGRRMEEAGASPNSVFIDATNSGSSNTILQSSVTSGAAFEVDATSTTLSGVGILGSTASPDGYGVYGLNTATSGDGTGVLGKAYATVGSGAGVFGMASSPDAFGVYGSNNANGGFDGVNELDTAAGVYGDNSATSGHTVGVQGRTRSPNGTGVFGLAGPRGYYSSGATFASGLAVGVYGETNAPDGQGAYGLNTATSGNATGVYGTVQSPNGRALLGQAGASGHVLSVGTAVGVEGDTYFSATSGVDASGSIYFTTGVYGHAFSTSGQAWGVFGRSDATNGGIGVNGCDYTGPWHTTSTVGVLGGTNNGVGVLGATHGGWGVQGISSSGIAVAAQIRAASGIPFVAWGASGQTASLQEWRNSSGAALSVVDANGYLGIGTASPQAALDVQATLSGVGILGSTTSPGGYGALGLNTATSGNGSGLCGQTQSTTGMGVKGSVENMTIADLAGPVGVGGVANNGRGVVGWSFGSGIGVEGYSAYGPAFVAYGASGQTSNLQEWRNSSGAALSVVNASGSLGVGTGAPGFTIHGVNPAADGALTLECYSSVGPIPRVNTRTSRGTPASPSASQVGDRLFQLSGYGRGASGFSSVGSIALIGWCAENFTDTTQGAYLAFWTTPIGSPSTARAERMRVDSNGNVGIGITSPAQKLDVTGNIHLTGTVMTGDIEFKNGIRATEDGAGLAFKNKSGKKIALLDDDGNLQVKGKITENPNL